MPCAKSSLQTFVDWLHQPQQDLFVNVVTAYLTIGPLDIPGQVDFGDRYVGSLTYVPVMLTGLPPEPGKPSPQFASFFQGNLIASDGVNHRHVFISLFDTIQILVDTIDGRTVTATVRFTDISCSSSNDSLSINSLDNDGRSYEIILRKSTFLVTPHHRFAG